jgi:hypothetical protein
MKTVSHVLLGAALVASAVAFSSPRAGGWAVVSVHTVSDAWIAGRPLPLAWDVRQHGVERLDGLRPTIEARSGSRVVAGSAWAHGDGYRGSVTIPAAGEWQVTIRSGFGRSRAVLLPWRVVDSTRAGVASVAALPAAERGRHAFAALGCVSCHVHGDVDIAGEVADQGPDLTGRRFAPDYLARFLADPSIKPPSNGRRMPNLALREQDILPLVAFLNTERRVTAR